MKARLLHPYAEFPWQWAKQAAAERAARRTGYRSYRPEGFDPRAGLPWNADDLLSDLGLLPLLEAMAKEDDWIFEVSRRVLLEGTSGDLNTIRYRQAVLQDCLEHPDVVRELYALVVETIQQLGGSYAGVLSRYPDWVLRESVETLRKVLGSLRRLLALADGSHHDFRSEGWRAFFAMVQENLGGAYLNDVEGHLYELTFPYGLLLSAQLGQANKGTRYLLHRVPRRHQTWMERWRAFFGPKPVVFRFEIHPRDEAGARALGELRSRAIAAAASSLGQAADHVRDFFLMLRAELAFYVGCLNLHEVLSRAGYPTCTPTPCPPRERRLAFRGLYDAGLVLTLNGPVVPNDLEADGQGLVFITGPNSGGKTTFLRSLGIAQLMMQAGMFVPAERYCASLCGGLFTHFPRGEDVRMERGKLDEELGRMSEITDRIRPDSVVLVNEAFASTNEREGSEIARQIVRALTEQGVRVFFVTHLFELARSFSSEGLGKVLFLRAERLPDGTRTYRIRVGEPLATSHGEDVYRQVFGSSPALTAHATYEEGGSARLDISQQHVAFGPGVRPG
jgi:hypothetical protein